MNIFNKIGWSEEYRDNRSSRFLSREFDRRTYYRDS